MYLSQFIEAETLARIQFSFTIVLASYLAATAYCDYIFRCKVTNDGCHT
jgi:hypothetical protein